MESHRKTLQLEMVTENADGTGVYFAVTELPAMKGQIQDALQRLRTADQAERFRDVSIRECPLLPELTDVSVLAPTLKELNFFAQRLETLPKEDLLLLRGVLRHHMEEGRYPESISAKELINLTYGLDTVMVASNVGNDEALGQFVIENDLNLDIADIPETSLYLLDRKQIGRMQRKNEGGIFVDGSYVVASTYEETEVYDGIHLPPEAREPEPGVFRLLVAQAPVNDPEETLEQAEWVSLPTTQNKAEEIARAKNMMCIEDCVYYDMDSAIPQINEQVFDSMERFSLLNQLAWEYYMMGEADQMKFKAALEVEPRLTVEKALDIAGHLKEYEFSPAPCDESDFFREYLARHLDANMDLRWLSGLSMQAQGIKLMQRLGASQTEYGFVSARGHSLYELVPYEEPEKILTSQAMTDEKLEVVEVLGQTALFTNGRVTEQELPEGLYRYDLREGESIAFSTIERNVAVNHAGTILTKAPLDFGGQEYFIFDEDTSPNFLGYDLTPEEFLQTDFTPEDQEQSSGPQMGGIQA